MVGVIRPVLGYVGVQGQLLDLCLGSFKSATEVLVLFKLFHVDGFKFVDPCFESFDDKLIVHASLTKGGLRSKRGSNRG